MTKPSAMPRTMPRTKPSAMPRTKPFYYLAEPTIVAEFPSLELSIFDYYMKDNTPTVALC